MSSEHKRAKERPNVGFGEAELLPFLHAEHPPATPEGLVPPFPWKLQVQTFSRCNAACVMCPWPETKYELDQGRMPEAIYRALLEQCAGRGLERLSLFLHNEPLLDVRLAEWTRWAKEQLPEALSVIYTNGWLYSPEKAGELADAGMGEVNVSLLSAEPKLVEEYAPGTPLEKILGYLEEISRGVERHDYGDCRITVAALDLPGVKESFAPYEDRWAARGLQIYYAPCTNRAGNAEGWGLGTGGLRRVVCQRPFTKGYILYDGRVILCNCDWRREVVLGNITEKPLHEIWHDAAYERIRTQLLTGTQAKGSICDRCDYPYVAAEEYQAGATLDV